ncbi:MAG TPA: hypothetical protein VII72_22825 [Myxococcota bacterium]|jgi:CDP-diglyceride synthetase
MASRLLRLGLSFVLLTAVLTWAWIQWGSAAYDRVLLAVAGPALEWIGVTRIADSPARQRFVSFVPFLVLTWLTPGLSTRRRAIGSLLGCALLFLAHVALVGVEQWSLSKRRPTADPFSTMFPAALFADSLPFMLWAAIAQDRLREWLVRLVGPRTRPDSGG